MRMGRKPDIAANEMMHPDSVAGWPLPEEQSDWIGEKAAEQVLLEAYRSGRIHHAWLICGPKGIGKATLAYRFARFVFSHAEPHSEEVALASDLSVDEADPAFRKVASGAHPNLLVLERGYNDERKRFYTELTVNQVRRTASFFGTTSGEPGWRIAIIDPADDMNASAANALLKILEEPPSRSLFLIIAHAPGRLVATIRSRCRRLNLAPLPATAIMDAITRNSSRSLDDDELRLTGRLAGGSLRKAIHFVEEGGVEAYQQLTGLLGSLPDLDIGTMHRLAESVGARGNDAAFEGFIDGLQAWLGRRVRGEDEADSAARPGQGVLATPLETWSEVWENLRRSVDLIDGLNLDRKQAVLSILMNLARATRM